MDQAYHALLGDICSESVSIVFSFRHVFISHNLTFVFCVGYACFFCLFFLLWQALTTRLNEKSEQVQQKCLTLSRFFFRMLLILTQRNFCFCASRLFFCFFFLQQALTLSFNEKLGHIKALEQFLYSLPDINQDGLITRFEVIEGGS